MTVKVKGDVSDLLEKLAAGEISVEAFSKAMSKLGADVHKSMGGMSKDAQDFDRVITSSLRDGETAVQSLQIKAKSLVKDIEGMRKSFAKTGSSSILGDLKGAEKDLSLVRNTLTQMGEEGAQA